MKIIIEPTSKVVYVNNTPTRVWQGVTEKGLEVHAYIALIGTAHNSEYLELAEVLQEVKPRADLEDLPPRWVVDHG